MAERDRNYPSYRVAACTVAMFDSAFFALLLSVAQQIGGIEITVLKLFPTSVFSLNALIWVSTVFLVELIYYRAFEYDLKIIKKFEGFDHKKLVNVRVIAYSYGMLVGIGGIVGLSSFLRDY